MMAFVGAFAGERRRTAKCRCGDSRPQEEAVADRRRRRLLVSGASAALGAAIGAFAPSPPAHAQEREWKKEELCKFCAGSGLQTCSFCSGSGVYIVGDTITSSPQRCPNCVGRGVLSCPRCIGLGLRNTKGILRDGAKAGLLRVRRDGSIDILRCEAFPSCDMSGGSSPAPTTLGSEAE